MVKYKRKRRRELVLTIIISRVIIVFFYPSFPSASDIFYDTAGRKNLETYMK